MNGAPPGDQIAGRLISPLTRSINTEYYDKIVARDSETLVRLGKAQLRAQGEAAVLNLRAQAKIARQQDTGNRLLTGIGEDVGALLGQAMRMNDQLDAIGYSLDSGFAQLDDALDRVDETLKRGFSGVIAVLREQVETSLQQQRTLTQISDTLRSPQETQADEWFREGDNWLNEGARAGGEHRKRYWDYALKQFQDCVNLNQGRKNYVAWFNIGFLFWKHTGDLAASEGAFDEAQSFSAPSGNLWHTKSLRHMAEVQYEQNRFEDAYQTIRRALNVSPEYLSGYNAARYAWKTQRRDEAIAMLDWCIELCPTTIVTMFSEPDFEQ